MTISSSSDAILDRALGAEDPKIRREAFVQLIRSDDWRLVLAPHVISCQGYRVRESVQPDLATFNAAATAIASSEDRVQRALELAGARFSGALLAALAREMGDALVEPALEHLRSADGVRNAVLQRALQEADPSWVKHPLAVPVIRRQLRVQDQTRVELISLLQRADVLADYVEELHHHPPMALEEWSSLGQAQIHDKRLFELAMGTLPHAPAPLLYLLRLDPLPEIVAQRLIASARGEWVAAAIEIAILDGLSSPLLTVLAEIGVRAGGRGLAAATAWISASKQAKPLLMRLAVAMEQSGRNRVSELLWIRRSAPSPDKALEQGRRGTEPDAMDAATLVRQLRGPKVPELVREIVEKPRPALVEPVLHHLCAVNEDAATELMRLCEHMDAEVAKRALEARAWPDVAWPTSDATQEIEFE